MPYYEAQRKLSAKSSDGPVDSRGCCVDSHTGIPQVACAAIFQVKSTSQQVAEYLREEIGKGVWTGMMPGKDRLVAQLGVGRDTVKMALRQLEQEGLLVGQGPGRRRRIHRVDQHSSKRRSLRIGFLSYDPISSEYGSFPQTRTLLEEKGHSVVDSPKTIRELDCNVDRISKSLEGVEVDAWIVMVARRDLLRWFSKRKIPTFVMFGVQSGLTIAGAAPDHPNGMCLAVRRLLGLGHRRIVFLISRSIQRSSGLGLTERSFVEELASAGIAVSDYHLPQWEESPEAYRACLEYLFRHTPPTALIIEESAFLVAAIQFCGDRGIGIPRDVSIMCLEEAKSFAMSLPSICHMRWDNRPLVRRILSWADHIAQGQEDCKQLSIPIELVEVGTLGPVPREN